MQTSTSKVWDTLIEVQTLFIDQFNKTGTEVFEPGMDRFNSPGWVNRVWSSASYRRAHVDVVDARETKGLWMMHCCIFPHTHNPAPIFGFDVIAGKNKITGCFYDYSAAGDKDHAMMDWFADEAQKLEWNKTRKLPDWAERIFSPSMVAAGNVSDEEELAQIIAMAKALDFIDPGIIVIIISFPNLLLLIQPSLFCLCIQSSVHVSFIIHRCLEIKISAFPPNFSRRNRQLEKLVFFF